MAPEELVFLSIIYDQNDTLMGREVGMRVKYCLNTISTLLIRIVLATHCNYNSFLGKHLSQCRTSQKVSVALEWVWWTLTPALTHLRGQRLEWCLSVILHNLSVNFLWARIKREPRLWKCPLQIYRWPRSWCAFLNDGWCGVVCYSQTAGPGCYKEAGWSINQSIRSKPLGSTLSWPLHELLPPGSCPAGAPCPGWGAISCKLKYTLFSLCWFWPWCFVPAKET